MIALLMYLQIKEKSNMIIHTHIVVGLAKNLGFIYIHYSMK